VIVIHGFIFILPNPMNQDGSSIPGTTRREFSQYLGENMTSEVIHGDCLEILKGFPDDHFSSVVTDPPYALNFMGRQWDSFTGRPSRNGSSFTAEKHEFQSWCEQWAGECLRVLKPGGHLLAFGGTRTYHRLTCGIEDAGFEIRDSLHWIYGSGFPKSLNVSKAIDKTTGAEREITGPGQPYGRGSLRNRSRVEMVTAPATENAVQWDDWGTALKPAHEPIVLARKPLDGTVVQNVLEYGTGALNIGGCRLNGGKQGPACSELGNDPGTGSGWDGNTGRWPPNILLSQDAAAEMDTQSGILTSGTGAFKRISAKGGSNSASIGAESRSEGTEMLSYGDSGGASRFFPCFKYQAKAPRSERPCSDEVKAHPTVKPLGLMRWLVRLVTPPEGIVLDPFAGTGTTGEACSLEGFRYILIEREEDYIKLINIRLAQPSLFD
jgi:DNA modification methylase